MIIKTHLVTRTLDEETFYRRVNNTIKNWQDEGLYVEVKYAENKGWYSAFVIGRQK